jgi:hypothetical protein
MSFFGNNHLMIAGPALYTRLAVYNPGRFITIEPISLGSVFAKVNLESGPSEIASPPS